MDPIVETLLGYGWGGVVVAVVLLLARVLGPSLSALLPGWLSTRAKREDLLMKALTQATRVMTETVSVLQSLRGEVAAVRQDQAELRSDVEHIAEQLDLPRPRGRKPAARRAKAAPSTEEVPTSG